LYLEDPDGNGLELYWDRPQLEWPIDESGELKMTNKTFDLDELLKEASNK
jgi:catechol 2,3-dioxygenase